MTDRTAAIENQLRKRIALRLGQGWSLEQIGARTAWRMFGHPYEVKGGRLIVAMQGGNESFGPAQEAR